MDKQSFFLQILQTVATFFVVAKTSLLKRGLVSQSGPVVSAPAGNLLEMQIFGAQQSVF